MQLLKVENFGPIKKVEIELSGLVVLIGEEASGKSTIAKLIYFFKSLGEVFFSDYFYSQKPTLNDNDIKKSIRYKFLEWFGVIYQSESFVLSYLYENEKKIIIRNNPNSALTVELSDNFAPIEFRKEIKGYKDNLIAIKNDLDLFQKPYDEIPLRVAQTSYLQRLSDLFNILFANYQNDLLYIVAGRDLTVGYPNLFSNLIAEKTRRDMENRGRKVFSMEDSSIDEILLYEFLKKVINIKDYFQRKGNFEGMIHFAPQSKKDKLVSAYKLIRKILHGQYADAGGEERIVIKGKSVYLRNASSGQQESIRILQDAFINILSGNKVLRIIEEPEAHLYPYSQNLLIQLFALVLNADTDNQIILTTHSPYILSALNNLLYGFKIGQNKGEEVHNIIDKKLWMDPSRIKCYKLAKGRAREIFDGDLASIDVSEIDEISSKLNDTYDKLMDIDFLD